MSGDALTVNPNRFSRRWTTASDPYPGLVFEPRKVSNPKPGYAAEVIAPSHWSQTAVDIAAGKYLRRAGVPSAVMPVNMPAVPLWLRPSRPLDKPEQFSHPGYHLGGETDFRQMFRRLAGCWTYWGWRLGYFGPTTQAQTFETVNPESETQAGIYYDEMRYMLAAQMFAPNSPQWFNTGLHWAYGIEGPECGQWSIRHAVTDHHGTQVRESNIPGEMENVEPSGPSYKRPGASACFILGIKDDLVNEGGIYDGLLREARIFKFGGGSGANVSHLRGEGEPLAGGGRSSGPLSFLGTFDAGAGAIKSAGVTRRAAKMVVMDVDHPDIEKFIRWKSEQEYLVGCILTGDAVLRKTLPALKRSGEDDAERVSEVEAAVAADLESENGSGNLDQIITESFGRHAMTALDLTLSAPELEYVHPGIAYRRRQAGRYGVDPVWPEEPYTTNFDSDSSAYRYAEGQNANNSVRVTNEFMNAVAEDKDWNLIRRTDRAVARKVKARYLWDLIGNAAWTSAEPGVQFDTTVNEWHTCPEDGPIRATNPCAEYHFLDDTACTLGSLRLTAFAIHKGGLKTGVTGFDCEAFKHAVRLAATTLDISVSMAAYPSKEIAEGSRKYRTIGLGYADLGALLMRMGKAYDSHSGMAWAAAITSLMQSTALINSAELAALVGAFPRYEANRDHCRRVVDNHRTFAVNLTERDSYWYSGLTVEPIPIRAATLGVNESVLDQVWDQAQHSLVMVNRHGLRNAQVSCIAPTGTIGLVMDCDTTGIEPDFALIKTKKLVGGGYMKIVNQSMPAALDALGYSPESADQIISYVFGRRKLPTRAPGDQLSADLLLHCGLTLEEVTAFEKALQTADTLADAGRMAVSEERWADLVGSAEGDPVYQLLTRWAPSYGLDERYEEDDVRTMYRSEERKLLGHGSPEGCPLIQSDHLAVFDCANRCGEGRRFIRPDAHVMMVAAAQPAISGAISKTINLPEDASPDDVKRTYLLSYRTMAKCTALYVDGSKLSQPLSARARAAVPKMPKPSGIFSAPSEPAYMPDPKLSQSPSGRVVEDVPEFARGQREKLPSRRKGDTQKFQLGGRTFYLRTGEYPDGRLGEFFLDVDKEGSAFRAMVSAFAISVSLGLQHGVPLEKYVESFLGMQFEPAGVLTGHERIKMASSFLDAVMKDLAIHYLGRDELAHVQVPKVIPEPAPEPKAQTFEPAQFVQVEPLAVGDVLSDAPVSNGRPKPSVMENVKAARAKSQGFSGLVCACGSFQVRRIGTCLECLDCYATSGCG